MPLPVQIVFAVLSIVRSHNEDASLFRLVIKNLQILPMAFANTCDCMVLFMSSQRLDMPYAD